MSDLGNFTKDIRGFLGDTLDRFGDIKQKRQDEYQQPVRLGDYAASQIDPLGRLSAVRTGLPGGNTWGTGAQGTLPTLDWLTQHGTPFRNPYNQASSQFALPGQNTGPGSYPLPGSSPSSGGTSSALEPNVARWASQTQQTFGDILDPDIMLAIMTNESHGDPNVQNHQGYPAYGLFQLWQQPGLTPDQQFQAARQLAQQKLALINQSYAANGLNPDARTRARDFALAWGGHFDYSTGRMNPNSRDVGSDQDAQALATVFLNNYDRIKASRQQGAAPQGGGALPALANTRTTQDGYAFPVVGWNQPVQLHWGSENGGSDIMAAEGTPIVAMRGGTVQWAGYDDLGGNAVSILGDDGLTYYYAHLQNTPQVQTGQKIGTGTTLGAVGKTGNAADGPAHLHLGIGYGIQTGGGPTGGLGINYDAVSLLNRILQQLYGGGGGGQLQP